MSSQVISVGQPLEGPSVTYLEGHFIFPLGQCVSGTVIVTFAQRLLSLECPSYADANGTIRRRKNSIAQLEYVNI